MFEINQVMKEIEQIYFNDFGVAFHWKKEQKVLKSKVQLVFKETGFYLSKEELNIFADTIDAACGDAHCNGCEFKRKCHKFLLKTPLQQIDLAVSVNELMQIKDLVEGTIFQIQLKEYLDEICQN